MPISRSALAPLTSIRFLAALRVALYHFIPWADKGYWWRGLMATPISVTYFFVSSGFLLSYNYAERADAGQMSTKRFFLGRIARLLPVYLMGLLAAAPLLFWHGDFVPGKALLTLFMLQSWSPDAALYWNTPAWALSDLAFFYLSLPLLLKLTRSASKRTCLTLGACAWVVSVALGVAYLLGNPDGLHEINNHTKAFWLHVFKYNPLLRLPEFIIGVAAGRLFLLTAGFSRRTSTTVFLVSCPVLLLFLLFGLRLPYPIINSGLLTPLLSLLLASLASGGLGADLLKLRWFVLLGQSSFCLYMLHIPIWGLAHRTSSPNWNLALVGVIIGVSLLLYRWVEVPASAALKRFLLPDPAPVGPGPIPATNPRALTEPAT
jgi:peptidoglycan/LPS O-acetylase OafA/YrhL